MYQRMISGFSGNAEADANSRVRHLLNDCRQTVFLGSIKKTLNGNNRIVVWWSENNVRELIMPKSHYYYIFIKNKVETD